MAHVSAAAAATFRSSEGLISLGCGRIACDHSSGRRGDVVLLHGNSSRGFVFDAQRAALEAAGWGVVTLDLPGHGASDDARDPAATYSFPGYAAVVSELADALGLAAFHLVGWSLGGHVALEVAATDPRARSVLVTGTPPVRPSPEALAEAFAGTSDMSLASKDRFSQADAEAYAGAMLDVPGAAPAAMVEAALRTDGRARRLMVESAVAGVGSDQAAFVSTASMPVAILQGRRDPFLVMDYFNRFEGARLWRGGVQWFDDLGHAPHWRAPERCNEAMLAFLMEQQGFPQSDRRGIVGVDQQGLGRS